MSWAFRAGILLGAGMALGDPASAAVGKPPPKPHVDASSVASAWTTFLGDIRDLPDRVIARLPAEQRDDPAVRQEAMRLAASAVTAALLDASAGDPDHPVFVPQLNAYITVGQPNADTSYRSARITPGGVYRLRGRRGTLNQANISQAGPRPKPASDGKLVLGPPRPVHDLNGLKTDSNGFYDVILSPARPAGHEGDWWRLDPTTDMLLVRLVSADWGHEDEPTLSIERLDAPAARPRAPAGVLAKRLVAAAAAANFIAPLLVDRPGRLVAEGYVNRFKAIDMSTLGGLAGQSYYEGAFALAGDEALLIETVMPAGCRYQSLILTNMLYETIDWYNNHSSLNGAQALVDADGVLRVVVSARDPGVPNWLDTAGHATGVVQGRWVGCETTPVPVVRKLAFASLRKALPAGTPTITATERERRVRDRRAALQQRPLW